MRVVRDPGQGLVQTRLGFAAPFGRDFGHEKVDVGAHVGHVRDKARVVPLVGPARPRLDEELLEVPLHVPVVEVFPIEEGLFVRVVGPRRGTGPFEKPIQRVCIRPVYVDLF